MQSTERVYLTFPAGLKGRAHQAGINISGVATAALLRSVQALEKEAPASSRQTIAGTTATCEGRAS